MPNCNQRTLAPTLIVCLAITGASLEGRKTLTMSIGMVMSSNLATMVSPCIFFPSEKGLTGIVR